MPALMKTDHTATITWLGVVPNRDTPEIETAAAGRLMLGFDGIEGSTHAGGTRPSDSRVLTQYPKGTTIRNTRQLSVVSAEELREIAEEMGLAELNPAWLGATMVIEGIPDFSHIPPASRLQAESGATITIDMQNRPCKFPALTIDAALPGGGKGFIEAATGRRGVTAWVEREGTVSIGETLRLHVPDQRAWRS